MTCFNQILKYNKIPAKLVQKLRILVRRFIDFVSKIVFLLCEATLDPSDSWDSAWHPTETKCPTNPSLKYPEISYPNWNTPERYDNYRKPSKLLCTSIAVGNLCAMATCFFFRNDFSRKLDPDTCRRKQRWTQHGRRQARTVRSAPRCKVRPRIRKVLEATVAGHGMRSCVKIGS